MALTEIEYGALASSEVMNNNFNYLDNRINNVSETIISNSAGFNSNIASINSTISSMSEKLNQDIEDLNSNLNLNINKTTSIFSENGVYLTTYINGNSWYREYFSDSGKQNRVWIEQGGVCSSRSTTTYLKAFNSATYTITLGTHDTNYEHGGISAKTATGFSHYDGKGWSYVVDWYACGK